VPRPAARIILRRPDGRVLLFRFDAPNRPPFWCLPGGALEPGETHSEAAARELLEECGIEADCGPELFRRQVEFTTLEQVAVEADERYYLVRATDEHIDTSGHTELERAVMREHRWFAGHEFGAWPETVYPEDLAQMLRELPEGA
jgi:8-oxo-dGTP pyrophosphatase MutT (NUDIX family)